MENWKAILFLLAAGQGFLLSLALVSQYQKPNKSNFFLGLILGIISLEILFSWAAQTGYVNQPDPFPFWYFLSYHVLPPSLWLFVQFSLNPDFRYNKRYAWFYLPAVLEVAIIWFQWGLIKIGWVNEPFNLIDIPIWFLFAEVVPLLWMIYVIAFFGMKLFNLNKRRIKTGINSTISSHLVKNFSLFLVLLSLTFFWTILVFSNYDVFDYVEILLTAVLFVFGYLGYFKQGFFDMPRSLITLNSESKTFPHFNDEKQLRRLEQVMEDRKLYLQNDLTLQNLAKNLNLPVRYVSYLINQYHGKNFRDFINSYRVKEVIRKINDPSEKHKTLLALAFESGFNSKSTFNHVFKAHTGETPSNYYQG